SAQRGDYAFLGMLGLGIAAGLGYGFLFSRPYTATMLAGQLDGRLVAWVPWLLFSLVLISVAVIFRHRVRVVLKWIAQHARFASLLMAGLLVLAGAYLYFIRPHGANTVMSYVEELDVWGPSFIKDTFVRWGWYFSWLGLLLAVTGYAIWLIRERHFVAAVPWSVGMFFTVVYVLNMRNIPLHILVMRRIIPVIFPIAVLMICYALSYLRDLGERFSRRWLKVPGAGWVVMVALIIPLLVFFAMSSRPVYGLSEGGPELPLTRQIASILPSDSVVLISPWLGNLAGPTLRYFNGIETARLISYETVYNPELPTLLKQVAHQGPLYLLWDNTQTLRELTAFRVRLIGDFSESEETLEASFEKRPQERVRMERVFSLYELNPV
ncbi:MAG: hypothetical protein PHI06_15235, partial [Desulfobulbaceae bacterium]|nr:hypothetical protein [Desulfobulbaceae bacterium]